MGYSSYLYKGIKVVLIFLVVVFWAFSIHFFLKNYVEVFVNNKPGSREEDMGTKMFRCYFEATLMLLLVSYGEYNIREVLEYVNAIFFLCFGFALQLFVYGELNFI